MSFKGVQGKYIKFKDEVWSNVETIQGPVVMVGQSNDEGAMNLSAAAIIGFAIGLIVLAAVVPDAIGQFYATNTSAWQIDGAEDTKTTVLWWLIPLVIVAAVVMMIYKNKDY